MPYLGSAATPRWNSNARAAFIGMAFTHGRAEMTRAIMEGVALEVRDMLEGWFKAGVEISALRLGGGATKSALWNQIQADVYGRPVETLVTSETAVLGAAILAGVGAGLFKSVPEAVDQMVKVKDRVEPNMKHHAVYEEMYRAFVCAYEGLASSGAYDQLGGYPGRINDLRLPRISRVRQLDELGSSSNEFVDIRSIRCSRTLGAPRCQTP